MRRIEESHTGRGPVWEVVMDNGNRVGPFHSYTEAKIRLERINKQHPIEKRCAYPACNCERPSDCGDDNVG